MALRDRLNKLRTEKDLSVAELSESSGVSAPYIRQIESGTKKNPTGSILQKLAVALGTTVADLLGDSLTVPNETLKGIPSSLRKLSKKKGKQLDLRQEDIEMLKTVHFRGKQPKKEEDWELIFLFLKRILG
ncbi:helix-turn-helix domain-containing protein [Candidatus Hydrogenedentota bacterium]